MVKEGRLPVVRIGRTWRFRKDLLDNWLSHFTETGLKANLQDLWHAFTFLTMNLPANKEEQMALTGRWARIEFLFQESTKLPVRVKYCDWL